ncbi:MAG: hypothetical protein F4X80_04365 [Chloroflexi bacterium]|nr:hypothetical protein [Chloroflexota bacterium]
MAAPQVLKPGHPDQLVVAAAAALLLAAATVWQATLSAAGTTPAPRSETVGATSSFEAVQSVALRISERDALPRDSRVTPVPGPAVIRSAATAGLLDSPASPPPRAGAGAPDASVAVFPKPFSPTLFDGASGAGALGQSPGRESLATAAHSTATPELQPGNRVVATVSFYYCTADSGHPGDGGAWCGAMRDGTVVYPGAAACDYEYLGQQFRIEGDPTGRVYTCNDTGSAVHGLHRDIWFRTNAEGWSWQRDVGRRVVIEIVN